MSIFGSRLTVAAVLAALPLALAAPARAATEPTLAQMRPVFLTNAQIVSAAGIPMTLAPAPVRSTASGGGVASFGRAPGTSQAARPVVATVTINWYASLTTYPSPASDLVGCYPGEKDCRVLSKSATRMVMSHRDRQGRPLVSAIEVVGHYAVWVNSWPAKGKAAATALTPTLKVLAAQVARLKAAAPR